MYVHQHNENKRSSEVILLRNFYKLSQNELASENNELASRNKEKTL